MSDTYTLGDDPKNVEHTDDCECTQCESDRAIDEEDDINFGKAVEAFYRNDPRFFIRGTLGKAIKL